MRRKDPLIIGAGPAGCAAAIGLARAGAQPLILERARDTGDALCGGFLSWRTMATLNRLGVAISGHPLHPLPVFSGAPLAGRQPLTKRRHTPVFELMEHFARAVRGAGAFPVTLPQVLNGIAAVEAFVESTQRNGELVALPQGD